MYEMKRHKLLVCQLELGEKDRKERIRCTDIGTVKYEDALKAL